MFSDQGRAALMDFFALFAKQWYTCDVEKKLRVTGAEYWWQVIEPLKRGFAEEIKKGEIVPLGGANDVMPCILVLPEQLVSLKEQFKLFKFTPKEVLQNINFDYFSRKLPSGGVGRPYALTNIRVRGPFASPQYLGSVGQKLAGQKERFLYLEEVLAVLLARRVNTSVAPWNASGLTGGIVAGLSGRRDTDKKGVERVSVPVVDFSQSCGVTLSAYTSDGKLTMSQYHRFFTCERTITA